MGRALALAHVALGHEPLGGSAKVGLGATAQAGKSEHVIADVHPSCPIGAAAWVLDSEDGCST
jgi:hypothetical protein